MNVRMVSINVALLFTATLATVRAAPTQYRPGGPYVASLANNNMQAWYIGNTNITTTTVNTTAAGIAGTVTYLTDQSNCAGTAACITSASGPNLATLGTYGVGTASNNPLNTNWDTPTVGVQWSTTTQIKTPSMSLQGGVTIAAWVRIAANPAATTFAPFMQLGGPSNFGYIYLGYSANWGFCVNHYNNLPAVVNNGPISSSGTCNGMGVGGPPANTALQQMAAPYGSGASVHTFGGWTHIAWTASNNDNSLYSLYINGMLVAQGSTQRDVAAYPSPLTPVNGGLLGYNAYYGNLPSQVAFTGVAGVVGVLGDLQIYSSVISSSSAEIMTLLNGIPGAFPSLSPETRFFATTSSQNINTTNTGAIGYITAPLTLMYNNSYIVNKQSVSPFVNNIPLPLSGQMSTSGQGMGFALGANNWYEINQGNNAPNSFEWGTSAHTAFTFQASIYRTTTASTQPDYSLFTLLLGPGAGQQQSTSITADLNVFSIHIAKGCPATIPTTTSPVTENAALGPVVFVRHPTCGIICYTSTQLTPASVLTGAVTGLFTPGSGMHTLSVSASGTKPMSVVLDGIAFAPYQFQSSFCTLSHTMWPTSIVATNAYIGNRDTLSAVDATPAFLVVDMGLTTTGNADNPTWVQATVPNGIAMATPPPPWSAASLSATPTTGTRYAACSNVIHRYGEAAGPTPFAGSVAVDMVGQLTGVFSSATTVLRGAATVASASRITFPAGCTALDFGPYQTGDYGLSVAFMTSNPPAVATSTTGACAANAPNVAGPVFDFGGYTMHYSSTAGPVYMTSPDGNLITYQAPNTTSAPNIPHVAYQYTVVTFGTSGTKVYVNGAIWISLPTLILPQQTLLQTMRFWGTGTGTVLLDLQFYDSVLSSLNVRKMSLGILCST